MNGVHDMGGQQGFGKVVPERDEPTFHHAWEGRTFAMTIAMGSTRQWNIDQSRHSRERIAPAKYLASTYYKKWFEGLSALLVEKGLVTREELADGRPRSPAVTTPKLTEEQARAVMTRNSSFERPAPNPARFAIGARVRTKNMHPTGHTRLPRYCRGKPGTIVKIHGVHVYPDTNALGRGEDPQWLYTVRFDARDLWGPDTTASAVFADLWEPYLE